MSHANPTPLRLGMTGAIAGRNYRIAGRIVMSMDEAGETYYWNEFNLIGDDGQCATLVYEETEDGPVWRLFRLIDPTIPLSAADVAGKRVGDPVDFGEGTFHVTCVDESRVCAIEGEAPEGVERGDIAHYFNAEAANQMFVVSWTGDEVEIYRGVTLPARAVAKAFGVSAVPTGALSRLSEASNGGRKQSAGIAGLVVFLIALVLLVSLRSGCARTVRAERPPKLPPAQLSVGSQGKLNASQYRVTGHAVVEVAHVGKRYLRHEYSVVDEAGNEAFLWQGTEQGADEWMLATAFTPSQPLRPAEAGALRLGQTVVVDDAADQITDLFLLRVGKADGATNWSTGTELYGFTARSSKAAKETSVALWNDTAITFYRVAPPTQKNPSKSFR